MYTIISNYSVHLSGYIFDDFCANYFLFFFVFVLYTNIQSSIIRSNCLGILAIVCTNVRIFVQMYIFDSLNMFNGPDVLLVITGAFDWFLFLFICKPDIWNRPQLGLL